MRTSSAARQFVAWAPLAALLIVFLPALAGAQEAAADSEVLKAQTRPDGVAAPPSSSRDRHRVSVGVSAGLGWRADIGDGASSYSGFDWVANVRFGLTTHLALEPEVGRWAHTEVSDYRNPAGWTERNEFAQSDWHVGVNLIGRVPGRRLSLFGGGGAGIWRVSEAYSLAASGSSTGTPPRTEQWDYADTKFGFQGIVGLDVNVTSRLQLFGVTRIQIVNREMYPFLFAVHGGVRLGL